MSQTSSLATRSVAGEADEVTARTMVYELNQAMKNYCNTYSRAQQFKNESVYLSANRYRHCLAAMVTEMSEKRDNFEGPERDRLGRAIERAQNVLDANSIFPVARLAFERLERGEGGSEAVDRVATPVAHQRVAHSVCSPPSSFRPSEVLRQLSRVRDNSPENSYKSFSGHNTPSPSVAPSVTPSDSVSQVGSRNKTPKTLPNRSHKKSAPDPRPKPTSSSKPLPEPDSSNLAQDQRNLLLRMGREIQALKDKNDSVRDKNDQQLASKLKTFEAIQAALLSQDEVLGSEVIGLIENDAVRANRNRDEAVGNWIESVTLEDPPTLPLPATYADAAVSHPLNPQQNRPVVHPPSGAVPKSQPPSSGGIRSYGNLAPLATASLNNENRMGGGGEAEGCLPGGVCLPQARVADARPQDFQPPQVSGDSLRFFSEKECRELVASGRPTKDNRFSDFGCKIDFDSHMNLFEQTVEVDGVKKLVQFLELQHWFAGPALAVCNIYKGDADPAEALKKAKEHLCRFYSRQSHTAHKMLNDVLSGKPLKNEAQSLRNFIIELEGVLKHAARTKREHSFNSPDIIANVLSKKLEFLANKWTDACLKRRERWDGEGPCPDATFNDFLTFLNRQHQWLMEKSAYQLSKPKVEEGKGGAKNSVVVASAEATAPKNKPFGPSAPAGKSFGNRRQNNGNQNNKGRNNNNNKNATSAPAPEANKTNDGPKKGTPATSSEEKSSSNNQHPSSAGWLCWVCRGDEYHRPDQCSVFMTLEVKERCDMVKKQERCHNCLKKGHFVKECTKTFRCAQCKGKHNTAIHRDDLAARRDGQEES